MSHARAVGVPVRELIFISQIHLASLFFIKKGKEDEAHTRNTIRLNETQLQYVFYTDYF